MQRTMHSILERRTKANYRSVSCCLDYRAVLAIPNKAPKIIANVTSHPWRLVITYVCLSVVSGTRFSDN